MGYPDTPWQQGDILKSEELNAMVPGLSPIGTIIPWALPYAEAGGAVYSNVAKFAPFHLPCTGGVYASSVAPLLSAAMGHAFIERIVRPGSQIYQVTQSGDVPANTGGFPSAPGSSDPSEIVVQDPARELHWHQWDGSSWLHRWQVDEGTLLTGQEADDGLLDSTGATPPHASVLQVDSTGKPIRRVDDGFVTPDFRGRSPIGANPNITTEYYGPDSGPTTVNIERGMRVGDWRVHDHDHRIQSTTLPSNFVVGHTTNRQDGTGLHTIEWNGNPGADTSRPLYAKTLPTDPGYGGYPGYPLEGQGSNLSPATGVHFLIFAGERISDPTPVTGTGGARSGEPVRMHPVTTASMIRKRLTDPNLSDDEREYLTALLNGEPWPPNDPPATRTATKTTRKTTTRKRKS